MHAVAAITVATCLLCNRRRYIRRRFCSHRSAFGCGYVLLLVVIVYRALHGTVPHYLSEELCYVDDVPARGRLRSSTSSLLDVRPSRRATVADRSFATAACPRIWNGFPDDVTSATPLLTCHRKLNANIFRQYYLTLFCNWFCSYSYSGPCGFVFTYATVNTISIIM